MKNISQDKNISDQGGIHKILYRYLPYWPLFVILFIVSMTGLFFYLKTTNSIYETTASVLIKDERKGQEESQIEGELNTTGAKNIVENEMEVLRSNITISQVVRNLHLYAPIFEEKGWRGIQVSSAYLTSPIVIEALDPDSIIPVKKVYFEFSQKDGVVMIGNNSFPLDKWSSTSWGKLKFSKNPHFLINTVEKKQSSKFFFVLVKPDNLVKGMSASISVIPTNRLSSIITMKLKDQVPQRAEAILMEVINSYNRISVGRKNDMAMRTLTFIEQRLKNVSAELDSIEGGIQKYRDRTGIVDIPEQSRLYLQSIEENDRQLNTLNMQLSALDEVENYVTSKGNQSNLVPSTVNISDPTLSTLLTKLSTAESEYQRLSKTTAENNPVLLSIKEEIDKTKPNILENIRSQRKNLQSGKSLINQTSGKYNSMLSSIPKKERELVDVSRQQTILSTTYAFLLQKREETASSISSTLPDCTIVDKPTSSINPVSPKKQLMAMVAAGLPFLIGFLIVGLKDFLNAKVLYRNDLEKLTDFPVIGEIINDKNKTNLVVQHGERNFIVEQFRQIRLALKFQGIPKGNIKRTLVTSSIKGEGKSFVSSNLAVSLARSGKKIAILEMDLHQPKLSEIFNVEKCKGITDFLMGKAKVEDIIVQTDVNANLCIIPAGTTVDEPSELLVTGKLEVLLDQLDNLFDILIIDTVPSKALTDAYTIAAHCNLVLYIVRHNYTPKMFIEKLDEDMKANQIPNVAIIFNGVKNRGWGKYANAQGYGYGYSAKSNYDSYNQKKIRRA